MKNVLLTSLISMRELQKILGGKDAVGKIPLACSVGSITLLLLGKAKLPTLPSTSRPLMMTSLTALNRRITVS